MYTYSLGMPRILPLTFTKPKSTSFHEDIKQSLERRSADVVQVAAPMTEMMRDIHVAIIQCIEAVLGDLKRNNGDVRSTS